MGTLGSGNHYLEVQEVSEIFDPETAGVFGLGVGDVVVSIHSGSRGLGHQVATDYLKAMVSAAPDEGIVLADRELACARLDSSLGRDYLGAMYAAMNCALANRQILSFRVRRVFRKVMGTESLPMLYDVSHNTCSAEPCMLEGRARTLFVHRKGATRALGPGCEEIPAVLRAAGQPVLIGGTMGTASFILVGDRQNDALSFRSASHGAGRSMSRTQATRRWRGTEVRDSLLRRGIHVRTRSFRGLAEEAPEAYKDVESVVKATEEAALARRVARLCPLACVKG
jgi:tRNA-splicing ligase RtcB